MASSVKGVEPKLQVSNWHARCLERQRTKVKHMEPVMITCDVCGQTATVHRIRYKYKATANDGAPADEHILTEKDRLIECPQCGTRHQIEKDGEA